MLLDGKRKQSCPDIVPCLPISLNHALIKPPSSSPLPAFISPCIHPVWPCHWNMWRLADTQRALQAVERLQAKLKERGEVPTEEKLNLLKSVLQSPLFHQILALQKSVQHLRDQVNLFFLDIQHITNQHSHRTALPFKCNALINNVVSINSSLIGERIWITILGMNDFVLSGSWVSKVMVNGRSALLMYGHKLPKWQMAASN